MDDFVPKPFGRRVLSDAQCKWLEPASAARAHEDLAGTLASLPALDVSAFDDLRDSLQWKSERLRHICVMFVSSAENLFGLFDGSAGIDRRALLRHLHTLLGSAGMVGARQVEYLAGKLKSAVQSNRQEEVPAVTDLLRQAMRRFEREFEARLEAVTPGGYSSQ